MARYLDKIILLAILVIALAGLSFSVQADTDVCNDTVNADLTLNASISDDSGDCFNITASNIIFDCAGFTVDGDSDTDGFGFFVNNTNNVTIKNCNISQFNVGIFLGNGNNHTVTNVTSTYNAREGIYLLSSNFNTLANLTLSSNTQEGLQLNLSANNTFTTATVTQNGLDGIYLIADSENNTFSDVVSNSNTLYGIKINSNNTLVNNATTNSNNQSGIYFIGEYNNVTNTSIRLNNVSGLYFDVESYNRIANNALCYNTDTYVGEYSMTDEFGNNTFCIDLQTLANNTISTNTSFELQGNITNIINNTNTSCLLYMGKNITANNTLTNNISIQFGIIPMIMKNNWNITCVDDAGNEGTSESFILDTRQSDGESCTNSSSCSGDYCVQSICRSAAYYCGDSYCDENYESSTSCSTDCGGGSDSSGSGGGSSAASTSVSTSFSDVADGDELTVDINRNNIPVEEVIIVAAEDSDSARVVVKGYSSKPSTVLEPSNKEIYKYIDVSATIDIEEAEIKFTVSSDWLTSNNVASSDIILMHYDADEEEWVELPTTYISGDNYKATTTSFSIFAISAKENVAVEEVKEETVKDKVTSAVEDVKDIIEEPVNKINLAGIIFIAIVFIIAIYFNKEKIHKKAKHVHHKHLRRRRH
ncbi:PGF-pre-PGF domain-containing protein [Candidatus Woesearchaeota archaeon]|jgi:PGF-pre-PGF domain-containing protein|nr:PGF-pre-PGF domain-containing protein [Candidatus Woesearchaeota archaeon]MBT7062368.1 PGF-pre-PGF domain-containing protein [Candidatus Woesearchaeota archaeon]